MSSYDLKKIGNRIRKHREDKKLSQFELSNKLGISNKTLVKIEYGETMPNLKQFLRMCELFDCDIGHLLCEYKPMHRVTSELQNEVSLSEIAINVLRENNPFLLSIINAILSDPDLIIKLHYLFSYFFLNPQFDSLYHRSDALSEINPSSSYEIDDKAVAYEYRFDKYTLNWFKGIVFSEEVFNTFAQKADLETIECAIEQLEVLYDDMPQKVKSELKKEIRNLKKEKKKVAECDKPDYFSRFKEIDFRNDFSFPKLSKMI